jgi:nucleoside phosphorylase
VTARVLAERRPRAVLHVGLAGSIDFTAPEFVIGSEARYSDTDSRLVPARAMPDATLVAAARAALPEARFCPIGTSARVGGTHGCEVEAMEGFAILRLRLAGVPAVEVRVTNDIGEPDRTRWQFDEAFELLRATLPAVVDALDA